MHQIKRYGWKPGLKDYRDFKFKVTAPVELPQVVDLRNGCPPVYNQGQLGSCTGNAIAAAYEFDLLKQGKIDFLPSRLFIYYNERTIEGTVYSDSGAMITDGLKTLNKQGVCSEGVWPYDISKFNVQPIADAYTQAQLNIITNYYKINDGDLFSMKQSLAKGFPFVFGFTVYDGFESEEVYMSGVLNMPDVSENIVGGHAVLCVGYNEKDQRFIVRNSWGEAWGQHGYFTMPYEYMKTMASDIWVINAV